MPKGQRVPMHLVTLPKTEAIQEAGRIGINPPEAKAKEKARKVKVIPHGEHQGIHQDTAVKAKAKVKAKARKAKVRKVKARQVTHLQVQLVHGILMEVVKPSYVSNI